MKQVVLMDASSIIFAWDVYPIANFPSLWKWLGEGAIAQGGVAMAAENFDEVEDNRPACHKWLAAHNVLVVEDSDATAQEMEQLKVCLGIDGEKYHREGVGRADIAAIATALAEGYDLMTNESPQNIRPNEKRRYKIPAVCEEFAPSVATFSFVEWLIRMNPRF